MKKKASTVDDFDDDDAPLTAEEMRTARPARIAEPELVAAYESGNLYMPDGRRVGRPKGSRKTSIALRIDRDVLDFFKSHGTGWQTRMNAALRGIMEALT